MNMNRFKTTKTAIGAFLIMFFCFFLSSISSAQTNQNLSYGLTGVTILPSSGLTILPSYTLLSVEEKIVAQLEAFPQEKIHLHTDRDYYVSGEKIWFKVYVVDAHSHLHPTYSQYVYVELISPADTLVSRVMIQQTDGMFCGHLPLPDIFPSGNYTLRAYTRYMENMGDDYFFKKNIRIENLSSIKNQSSPTAQNNSAGIRNRSNRVQTETETDDFDVSFFPEGGNLPDGAVCKVAYKAINRKGYPETVSGKIVDENGVETFIETETLHAGMGVFVFRPEMGKRVFLKFRNENGLVKQFELPQPEAHAWSLTASMRDDRLIIGVQKSVHTPDIPCYLLVHCRGAVFYFAEWDKKQEFAAFPAEQLPAGVVQFVLFDGQMNPLSERLVFSKNDDASAKVDFQTDKAEYEKRDKIVATLKLDSIPRSIPLVEGWGGASGHFSIAITDDMDIDVDESTTILSTLLLSSELKGYIENPAYYLHHPAAMDLLMMTHGWRRYNVPEALKGNLQYPQIPFQIAQEITGQVKTLISGKPVVGSEILIMMQGSDGGFVVSTTDENGSFMIQGAFPDSSTFYIRALNRRGRENNVELFVDHDLFPRLTYAPQSPIPAVAKTITVTGEEPVGAFMEKAEQRATFDEDIWKLQLEEVKITAPRIQKVEPRLQFWLNSSSDKTITRKTIEDFYSTAMDIDHLLMAVFPNMASEEDEYGFIHFFIPSRTLMGANPRVLIFIDGSDVTDFFDKSSVFTHEIESIDILRHGSGGTVFGIHGSAGISITTKRGVTGVLEKFNHIVYTPLGYQMPTEFYSPKYETLEAKRSVIPDLRTTIFWKPDVVISEDGEASFQFYTSDFKTTYSVVIEGITDDGRIVRQVEKIRVE